MRKHMKKRIPGCTYKLLNYSCIMLDMHQVNTTLTNQWNEYRSLHTFPFLHEQNKFYLPNNGRRWPSLNFYGNLHWQHCFQLHTWWGLPSRWPQHITTSSPTLHHERCPFLMLPISHGWMKKMLTTFHFCALGNLREIEVYQALSTVIAYQYALILVHPAVQWQFSIYLNGSNRKCEAYRNSIRIIRQRDWHCSMDFYGWQWTGNWLAY